MDKKVETRRVNLADFIAEAEQLFGKDRAGWRFVCPGCGHIASVQNYKDAGAPEGAVGFSCVGRWLGNGRDWVGQEGPGPCDYTTGGLINISPIILIDNEGKEHSYFDLDRRVK